MIASVLVVLSLLQGYGNAAVKEEVAVGAFIPSLTDYPWVLAVYKTDGDKAIFNYICGATLIGEDVAISAAHCFWNEGEAVPLEEYRLTAGNDYRDINREEPKQIRQVKNIKIHEQFRDHLLNYANDIAIVWLDRKLDTSTPNVHAIAIDWNNNFDASELEGQHGIVVGWGFTDDNKPSQQRLAVRLPYINFATCWKAVPEEFLQFLTSDKFCAGHRNGTAVCSGASGGGLAFKHPKNEIWYLMGIINTAVPSKGVHPCFKTQYFAVTSINRNLLWLKQHLNSKVGET